MNEIFKSICNEDSAILKTLTKGINVRKLQNGKEFRFLAYIDHIVEYYLNTSTPSEHNQPRFIMINIPDAEPWAKPLCIEYLFVKMNLQYGNSYKEVPRIRVLDETKMGKDAFEKALKKNNKIRRIKRAVSAIKDHNTNIIKSLFWVNEKDRNSLCGNPLVDDILHIHPEYLTNKIAIDYEDEFSTNVDNLFLFPGTRHDNARYYNVGALSGWNKLKNCFVFIFGNRPYFLSTLLERANLWCDVFVGLSLKEVVDEGMHDFIGLRKKERDYLFHEDDRQTVYLLPQNNVGAEELVEIYSNNIFSRDRNILSLCGDTQTQELYKQYLSQRPGAVLLQNDYLSFTFDYVCDCLLQLKKQLFTIISNFSEDEKVGIVVDCHTPENIKKTLKKSLKSEGIECKFYTYNDLKKRDKKRLNNITENKIIVLLYTINEIKWRLDDGDVVTKSFIPNSFDGYKLSKGQELIEIVNEVTACDYQNQLNNYNKKLNFYTRSIYRNIVLNDYGLPIEKSNSIWSRLYNHDEYRDSEGTQQTVPSYKFEFSDGSKESIPETDYVVYQKREGDEQFCIEQLRELASKIQIENVYAVQSLSSLADGTIDIFINEKIKEANNFENSLRKQYIDIGIIPNDKAYVNVPIWKFLLKKRLEDACLDKGIVTSDDIKKANTVWNLLKYKIDDPQLFEIYKEMGVSCSIRTVIYNWCNIENETPITPGVRADRTNLIENFLSMGQAVVSLYNQKQRFQRNNTRQSNELKDKFLQTVLFKPFSEYMAKEVMEIDNIQDFLPVETNEDIEVLKNIVEEKIEVKPIKSYTYANN